MKCPDCNNIVPDGSKFCNHCGHKFEQENTIKCPNSECGHLIPADSKFCPDCGYEIKVKQSFSISKEDWMFFFPYQNGKDSNGAPLYGYKDIRSGKVVISPKYNSAYRFYEGLASVGIKTRDNKYHMGFIDSKGREVIPLTYSLAFRYSEGKAWVQENNKEWCCINKNGEYLFSYPFTYLSSNEWEIFGTPGYYLNGITNGTLQYIGEPDDFLNSNTHLDSYVNDRGEEISSDDIDKYQWLYSETESENAKVFESTNGLYGIKDNLGNIVVSPYYDDITHNGGGIFVVKKDEQYGAFFENGKELAPCMFSDSPLVYELKCQIEFWENDGYYKFDYWGRIN